MTVKDISENQGLHQIDFASADGWLIRAGTGQPGVGIREDHNWRSFFNQCVQAQKPLGLYWFAGTQPEAEARFFHNLISFLVAPTAPPGQVHLGFFVDAEQGQDAGYVDRFRSAVALPWCGLYSTVSAFNGPLARYLHFGLNWIAWPDGNTLEAGWELPDHIIRQRGIGPDGLDFNELTPAVPVPPAWAA